MKAGPLLIAGAIIVAAGAGAFAVRGLAPSDSAIEEGTAFTTAHNKMMNAMVGSGVSFSGDADADFAMFMGPHHQGAIDVANVELKYGTNPAARVLAQRMMVAQKGEIDQIGGWRKTHPASASSAAGVAEAFALA